jgi:hypothetical protein
MKNITLSAPEDLIEKARKNATAKGSTLNEEFRQWLKTQAVTDGEAYAARYQQLMAQLAHVNSGRRFSREEMNER